jgi:hypothetical protein
MADVAITVKYTASEFQTLREELKAHAASLRTGAKSARDAGNVRDSHDLTTRQAQVTFLLEKMG